jgi:hypothetical protein
VVCLAPGACARCRCPALILSTSPVERRSLRCATRESSLSSKPAVAKSCRGSLAIFCVARLARYYFDPELLGRLRQPALTASVRVER